ncbi:Chaperone protein DnaJ [Rhynchospora pubera]|uniref:Chaperone protein DnaJ n=1 Tax=Rhynchospora pubera TaxID=906938 RepID=A0AAV8E953_9POAL|nr:Chaperone protein DnaJ [Rhynchospora pubera]
MASSLTFSSQSSIAGLPHIKHRTRTTVTCAAATAAPPRSTSSSTLYDVLRIQSGATCREIKAAYRRLVLEFHPDIVPAEQKADSASEFIRIHDAYATLSDPDKKASYDRGMMVAAMATATASASRWTQSTPPPRSGRPFYNRRPRTWETDQCW